MKLMINQFLFAHETELLLKVFTLEKNQTNKKTQTQIKAQTQHDVMLQGHAMNEWSDTEMKTFISPGV